MMCNLTLPTSYPVITILFLFIQCTTNVAHCKNKQNIQNMSRKIFNIGSEALHIIFDGGPQSFKTQYVTSKIALPLSSDISFIKPIVSFKSIYQLLPTYVIQELSLRDENGLKYIKYPYWNLKMHNILMKYCCSCSKSRPRFA